MPFSVVKIFCTVRNVSYSEPWRKESSRNVTGTASLIEDGGRKYVITNEHVIRGDTSIYVTVEGSSKQFPANIVYRNHSCDLALLEITSEKEAFEALVQYMPLNHEFPPHGTKLTTQGFPTGGQGYCTTEGTVSRVESASYINYAPPLLRIQISAPINPGSSGGLAITDTPHKVLGITSSGITSAQNIGYIIPSTVIRAFLNQFLRIEKNPHLQAINFPSLMISTQELRQKSLREKYGLTTRDSASEEHGVLIKEVPELSLASHFLKEGDVLLALDSHNVRSDGKINYHGAEIEIGAYIATKQIGDTVDVKILRQETSTQVWFEVIVPIRLAQQYNSLLLLGNQPNKDLPYYVHPDGAVFIVPDTFFVYSYDKVASAGSTTFRDTSARPRLLDFHLGRKKTEERRQFVYLYTILTTNATLGAEKIGGAVDSINGQKITSLNQLALILETMHNDAELALIDGTRLILSPNTPAKESSFCEKQGISKRMSPSVMSYLTLADDERKRVIYYKNVHDEIVDQARKPLQTVPEEKKSIRDFVNFSMFNTEKPTSSDTDINGDQAQSKL